ncbi:hypothetical protein M3Y97_00920400 [Aphelenchoides bicaudatus]|nr:hypothetical protein M3Y97_00920400 [Aphelenchoides bicaudatus]
MNLSTHGSTISTISTMMHCYHLLMLFITGDWPFKQVFVNNLVHQRVISEANNLKVYADLIQDINDEELEEYLLSELATTCKELLEKAEASSANKEALRNVGTFLGLVTIVRNKPIPAEHFDFCPLLESAVSSRDEVRLIMTIVFVTHVLKYCQFSLIFRQNCTWVSRIIDALNAIYSNFSSNPYISLEIERFSDGLKKMNGTEKTLDMYFKATKSAKSTATNRQADQR